MKELYNELKNIYNLFKNNNKDDYTCTELRKLIHNVDNNSNDTDKKDWINGQLEPVDVIWFLNVKFNILNSNSNIITENKFKLYNDLQRSDGEMFKEYNDFLQSDKDNIIKSTTSKLKKIFNEELIDLNIHFNNRNNIEDSLEKTTENDNGIVMMKIHEDDNVTFNISDYIPESMKIEESQQKTYYMEYKKYIKFGELLIVHTNRNGYNGIINNAIIMPEKNLILKNESGSSIISTKKLRSIILHESHGSDAGHYTCLINCNKNNDIWHHYNDIKKEKFELIGKFEDITSDEKDYLRRCTDFIYI